MEIQKTSNFLCKFVSNCTIVFQSPETQKDLRFISLMCWFYIRNYIHCSKFERLNYLLSVSFSRVLFSFLFYPTKSTDISFYISDFVVSNCNGRCMNLRHKPSIGGACTWKFTWIDQIIWEKLKSLQFAMSWLSDLLFPVCLTHVECKFELSSFSLVLTCWWHKLFRHSVYHSWARNFCRGVFING